MPPPNQSDAPSEVRASDDVDNSTIIDGLGRLITAGVNVGAPGFVVAGAAVVDVVGRVVRIASIGDTEGEPPIVYVEWPELPGDPEAYSCNVRDYRQEGPSGPYVYVCDDLVVVEQEETDAGEQAQRDQALADAKLDRDAAAGADAMREGLTPPSRPAGGDV